MSLRSGEPIHKLNQYYRKNSGFRKWVKANEEFFQQNPEVFQEFLEDPTMVNLFIDVLMMNANTIKRKLTKG